MFRKKNNLPNTGNLREKNKPNYNDYFSTDFNLTESANSPRAQKSLSLIWKVLVLMALLTLVFGFFGLTMAYFNQPKETKEYNAVEVFVTGPENIATFGSGIWEINIHNKNDVPIHNLDLKLNFDSKFSYFSSSPQASNSEGNSFQIEYLGTEGDSSKTKIILEGTINGKVDEELSFSGTLSYTPEPQLNLGVPKLNKDFSGLKVVISSAEVKANLEMGKKLVQSGETIKLSIIYQNLTEKTLKDLKLRLIFPEKNFSISSAKYVSKNTAYKNINLDEGMILELEELTRYEEQEIEISGIITGTGGVKQDFEIEMLKGNEQKKYQTIDRVSRSVTINNQPLNIRTYIKDREEEKFYESGDSLPITIEYENISDKTIRNLEITFLVEDKANVLDISSTKFNSKQIGIFQDDEILWKGSSITKLNELLPKDKGEIEFSIPVKEEDNFIQSSLNSEDYILTPMVTVKGTNLEQLESQGNSYRPRSKIEFEQEINLNGSQNGTDTYTVTWKISNQQNNILNLRIYTTTDTNKHPEFSNSIAPQEKSDEIIFDDKNGRIEWNIGFLPAYTGINSEPATISYEIKVPSSFDESQIIGESKVTAVDSFTFEKYEISLKPKINK